MIRKLLVLTILFLTAANAFAQKPKEKHESASQSAPLKQVSTFTIEAPQLHSTKKIWIYLPENYNSTDKKYPVIYMLDGQNLFEDKISSTANWNIDKKLDSLKAPIIIVGIDNENEKFNNEKTNQYLDFIANTLKPKIDTQYRTKSNLTNTAIMGSSLGGLISFTAVLKYPKVFGKAGVFSPIFDNSEDIFTATENMEKIKAKIYFLYGDNENATMIPNISKMDYILAGKRCDCQYLTKKRMVKGGQHNEKLWRDGFVKAYLWLF